MATFSYSTESQADAFTLSLGEVDRSVFPSVLPVLKIEDGDVLEVFEFSDVNTVSQAYIVEYMAFARHNIEWYRAATVATLICNTSINMRYPDVMDHRVAVCLRECASFASVSTNSSVRYSVSSIYTSDRGARMYMQTVLTGGDVGPLPPWSKDQDRSVILKSAETVTATLVFDVGERGHIRDKIRYLGPGAARVFGRLLDGYKQNTLSVLSGRLFDTSSVPVFMNAVEDGVMPWFRTSGGRLDDFGDSIHVEITGFIGGDKILMHGMWISPLVIKIFTIINLELPSDVTAQYAFKMSMSEVNDRDLYNNGMSVAELGLPPDGRDLTKCLLGITRDTNTGFPKVTNFRIRSKGQTFDYYGGDLGTLPMMYPTPEFARAFASHLDGHPNKLLIFNAASATLDTWVKCGFPRLGLRYMCVEVKGSYVYRLFIDSVRYVVYPVRFSGNGMPNINFTDSESGVNLGGWLVMLQLLCTRRFMVSSHAAPIFRGPRGRLLLDYSHDEEDFYPDLVKYLPLPQAFLRTILCAPGCEEYPITIAPVLSDINLHAYMAFFPDYEVYTGVKAEALDPRSPSFRKIAKCVEINVRPIKTFTVYQLDRIPTPTEVMSIINPNIDQLYVLKTRRYLIYFKVVDHALKFYIDTYQLTSYIARSGGIRSNLISFGSLTMCSYSTRARFGDLKVVKRPVVFG